MVNKLLGGSSSGPSQTTQTVTNAPPEYLKPYLTEIAKKSQDAYAEYIAKGYNQPYAGTRTAGKNQYDSMGQDMALSAAAQSEGAPQQTYDIANMLGTKLQSGGYGDASKMGYDVKDNNYVNDAIMGEVNPIIQKFQESTMPSLKSAAIDRGAYGGSKSSEVMGQVARDTQKQVGDLAAKISYQNFNDSRTLEQQDLAQRRNLMLQGNQQELTAGQLVPTLASDALTQGLNTAGVYSNAGQFDRGFEQQTLNDEIAKWNELTASPWAGLDNYSNLIYGGSNAGGRTQTSSVPGQSGLTSWMSGLGGLNSAASGINSLLGIGGTNTGSLGSLANMGSALYSFLI